jgi:hypothetical protein
MAPTLVIRARHVGRHRRAIYIGREHAGRGRGPSFKRSRWANPIKLGVCGRATAVDIYARWLDGDAAVTAMLPPGRWHHPSVEEIRRELRGRVLACWSDPEPCHGHVLAAIADDETPGGEVPPGNTEEG